MQKIQIVQPDSKLNPLDALAYNVTTGLPESLHYYIVDDFEDTDVDILIHSIHSTKPKNAGYADVEVISYVPDITDAAWPEFFMRLSLSKMIACDSYTKQQLGNLSFPDKRWINLDGVTIIVDPNKDIAEKVERMKTAIRFGCTTPNDKLWKNYCSWIDYNSNVISLFKTDDDLANCDVIIGLDTVSPLLANALAQTYAYVWLPYHPDTSLYLDGRHTHNYMKSFNKIAGIQGAAHSKMITEVFSVMTQELVDLIVHSATTSVPVYHSNVNIIDRVFNEINRAS